MNRAALPVSRRTFLKAAGLAVAGAASCSQGLSPAEPEDAEARFYEPLEGRAVRCMLCPWHCQVPDGERGRCRVRENRGGKYRSLVYGRPCTLNPDDPIQKKPFFHVYPGSLTFSLATLGCNIACAFCQNWDISQADPKKTRQPAYRSPADIARMAREAGARTVAYTYSEPTVFYEFMYDCAREAKSLGLGNIVVSNGFIEAEPLKALLPLLTAYKVDLKSFAEPFYRDVCGAALQPVLDSLKRLAGSGVWFEIVVLIIPTLNDGTDEVKRMAAWVVKELGSDVPLHFTRFHAAYKLANLPATPPQTVRLAREAAMAEGVRFAYTGNLPGDDGEHTYCPQCRAVLIKRYGFLVLANSLKAGRCPACNAAIPGVWA